MYIPNATRAYRARVSTVPATAIEIRPSTVAEMHRVAGVLFASHYEEVAARRQNTPLSPDWLRYQALEQHGSLITLAAWEGERIVGYSVSIVTTALHYSTTIFCQNDVLFVAEAHRRGRLGIRLIRETERIAVAGGTKRVFWHAKQGTALAAILPRLGYGVHELVYSRDF